VGYLIFDFRLNVLCFSPFGSLAHDSSEDDSGQESKESADGLKFCILIGIGFSMIILCSTDSIFVLQRELSARDSIKHEVRPNGRGHIAKETWISPEHNYV